MAKTMKQNRRKATVVATTRKYGLTGRESQVLVRLAMGRPNREIGKNLGIGLRTVEGHVARVFKKCGCKSRTQLITKLFV